MDKGSIIKGFRIDNLRFAEELNGIVYEMTHLKTGASLVWVDNGAENKVFSISFKTIPDDDTGVFHILEHCVFQGSSKYPAHHMFTELLKGSVHTYLNAATMPDRTTFPVASCNEKDFMNLADVYLSSVLHPMVLSEPHIFEQEGWHYEISEDGELYANGVVYNEMKGMYTSQGYMLMEELAGALYEGTGYDCSAGGVPSHITELSYEMLKEAHSKYYNPGNSFTYLDGAMDIEAVLGMIDGYFSEYDAGEVIAFREPDVLARREVECEYAAMDELEGATLAVGRVIDGYRGANDSFAFGILMDYLAGSNESVLTKAIMSLGIAYEVSAYMDANNHLPHIALILKQIDSDRKDEALELVREVIEGLKTSGLDRDNLEACIDQLEYKLKDIEEPAGLIRGEMALAGWMYGNDVIEMMTFNGLPSYLRECIDDGTYERLLEELRFDGDGTAEVMLLPSFDKKERDAALEVARFEAVKAGISEAELQAIADNQNALEEWRASPDSDEILASIPRIELKDLSLKKQKIETSSEVAGGRPVLLHRTRTNGLTYCRLYFSVADCSEDELLKLSVMTNIIGMLPTKQYSLAELEKLQRRYLGGFDCNISAYAVRGKREACRPYFEASFMCLPQYEEKAIALAYEILTATDYESDESIEMQYAILMQGYQSLYDSLLEAGSSFAIKRAGSHVYAPAYFGELIEGYEFIKYLGHLMEDYDACCREYAADEKSIADRIFGRERMTVSINSDRAAEAQRGLAERMLKAFARDCGENDAVDEIMRVTLDEISSRELIQIPSQVGYAASTGYSRELEDNYNGGVNALAQIIDFEYLWDRIRTRGGAYGCNSHISSAGLWGMTSYRDPNPVASLNVFEKTPEFVNEFLAGLCEDAGAIDNYIIGAFSAVDPLMDGYTMGRRADDDWFGGITSDERAKRKEELLHAKVEELFKFAPVLAEHNYKCIVGSIDMIPETEKDSWTIL